MNIQEAKRLGYYITSRSGKLASRIDRHDWKEFMSSKGIPPNADLYRRCYSKDTIYVPASFVGKLKNSHCGYEEFRGY